MFDQFAGLDNECHGEIFGTVKLLPVTIISKFPDGKGKVFQ
jgi:hypothetical protein